MKIKEFNSSGIKENGKIDISLKCDNGKEYRFLNCEIDANNVDKDYNTCDCDCNLTFKYDNYELV
jgi:hypothetical protein